MLVPLKSKIPPRSGQRSCDIGLLARARHPLRPRASVQFVRLPLPAECAGQRSNDQDLVARKRPVLKAPVSFENRFGRAQAAIWIAPVGPLPLKVWPVRRPGQRRSR